VAMGKHTIEDEKAYRAQVTTFEEGAAAFVTFVHVAINKHLGWAPPTRPAAA
jgi:hypothetical protein